MEHWPPNPSNPPPNPIAQNLRIRQVPWLSYDREINNRGVYRWEGEEEVWEPEGDGTKEARLGAMGSSALKKEEEPGASRKCGKEAEGGRKQILSSHRHLNISVCPSERDSDPQHCKVGHLCCLQAGEIC